MPSDTLEDSSQKNLSYAFTSAQSQMIGSKP